MCFVIVNFSDKIFWHIGKEQMITSVKVNVIRNLRSFPLS